ncbi:50S ribosomal protein L29 [Geotalea toluenoxydans]|uniref:50S ribosomal protein L29 n=1 Tax=Geotalea toluenoxydans TaxID=421624 RepID=UPI0006D1F134|nr:50S ribosomal protein L29 [Geotalea toluenoxydans]
MKASDLNKSTVDELRSTEAELTKELFNLKFQLHTGRLEDTSKPARIKKDIARVKTVLRAKRG